MFLSNSLRLWSTISVGIVLLGRWGAAYETDPINYSGATPKNAISQLQVKLDQGLTRLEFQAPHGFLPALLRELKIATSSQVLTFSRTSLQPENFSRDAAGDLFQ